MFPWNKDNLKIDKNTKNITVIIDRIKKGDKELRERFIDAYKPFVLSAVSRTMNRYIEIENSEEYSIALIAFNEAIDDYNKDKNNHFMGFAELVIRRRLLNHIKRERKTINTYPFSFFEIGKDNHLNKLISEKSIVLYFDKFEAREEISIFNKRIKRFGISLHELINITPKHRDSRQKMLQVAKIIAENDYLYEKLDRKTYIPMSELTPLISISPKTVEKNRKYIIAACIAMRSDLEIIKGFLKGYIERG